MEGDQANGAINRVSEGNVGDRLREPARTSGAYPRNDRRRIAARFSGRAS